MPKEIASKSSRVLIVDDDDSLRQALAEQLAIHEDFVPVTAASGGEALSLLGDDRPDMILLDVGLPDIDGRELCRMIRRRGIQVPIIMLTAMDSDPDVILGLEAGANDYVAKPFRIGVLLARIRVQLRQYAVSEHAAFPLGPYTFWPSRRILQCRSTGAEIGLSETENQILKVLYRAGDTVVSPDTLYSKVWGYRTALNTHTLQTHIYRLRQKIESDPSQPSILVSETGGYRVLA